MELKEFLLETLAEVQAQYSERMTEVGATCPYPELVFTEIVMRHMSEVGMTFDYDPTVCHFKKKLGVSNAKLSGYSFSEDLDQLDLFVTLYSGLEEVTTITDSDTKAAAEACLKLYSSCVERKLSTLVDPSSEIYPLAVTLQEAHLNIDAIRVYVLTDRKAKSKNFKPREISGKTIKLEVMDIERLYRHLSEGKQRDELKIDFEDLAGGSLPCVYVPGQVSDYDYALTAIPAEVLRHVYEKYGPRLLEANVRSFLSLTGKVNKGIRETLRNCPEKFLAYNNGIVLVTDQIRLTEEGNGILFLQGMQIVNGGQTTASIYFTKKKNPEVDLSHARVPAKIIVLRSDDPQNEELLISDISRYANSQNKVNQSDLSANKPFHVEVEKLSMQVYCPDGVGRWFYERASGSYKTFLAREGTTKAKEKQLKATVPPSRKITKTDLAKFLNSWDQLPHIVSRGSQKNFEEFMKLLTPLEEGTPSLPVAKDYKHMVAKAIVYKSIHKVILSSPDFNAFQSNTCTYTVSLLSNRLGTRLDLDKIWMNQSISGQLKTLVTDWSKDVYAVLQNTAQGRMISEWAKRKECWEAVKDAAYPDFSIDIPELRIS